MRFVLTYDGLLPSSAKAPIKQRIREALHPQLKELWTHQPLSDHREALKPDDGTGNTVSVLTHLDGHFFAAAVSSRLHLLAELHIEMLRPEPPGGIITNQGDIDNRLKTLFDALRAPSQGQEIKPGAMASTESDPVFTLLDDDRLITKVSVDTGRLLAPWDASPDYTRLTIHVDVRASRLVWANIGLAG